MFPFGKYIASPEDVLFHLDSEPVDGPSAWDLMGVRDCLLGRYIFSVNQLGFRKVVVIASLPISFDLEYQNKNDQINYSLLCFALLAGKLSSVGRFYK